MYSATSGALVAQAAVDTIANNLANVNTAGFKRTLLQVQAQPEREVFRFQTDPGQVPSNRLAGVPTQQSIGTLGTGAQVYDTPAVFEQGAIAATGNDLDVALSGPGFIAVRSGTGALNYTRDGEFMRDQNGYLTAQNGDRVLGSGGDPIVLPNQGAVQIARDGSVSVNGQTINRIAVVEFTNPTALRPEGSSRFVDTGAAGARVATNTTALQGSVEKSNADVVSSMVDLITNERWFDANQKAIQTQDTAVAQAIQTVGRSNQ
jgi:flagellar basal-body rod protein FlgF